MNQADVFNWRVRAFKHPPSSLLQAAKVAEEAGEVLGAVVKKQTGVKQHIDWAEEIKKEISDLLFAMFTVAEIEGFDLLETAAKHWEEVSQRDYR
jgi:NTP pyrophosphatase (non-canonical NTP hydrolase)